MLVTRLTMMHLWAFLLNLLAFPVKTEVLVSGRLAMVVVPSLASSSCSAASSGGCGGVPLAAQGTGLVLLGVKEAGGLLLAREACGPWWRESLGRCYWRRRLVAQGAEAAWGWGQVPLVH